MKIVSIQQIGNDQNDHDDNDNPNLVFEYENTNINSNFEGGGASNLPPSSKLAFMGGIVAFPRCAYVFNFAYDPLTQINTYLAERFTVSIEYDTTLEPKRKRTIFNKKGSSKFYKLGNSSPNNNLPCYNTEFYYHPGIGAIF